MRFEFEVESAAGGERLPKQAASLLASRCIDRGRRGTARPSVHPGERWLFTVRLRRPHGHVNPHGFDYEAWLLERGVGATGYVRPKGERKRLGQRTA